MVAFVKPFAEASCLFAAQAILGGLQPGRLDIMRWLPDGGDVEQGHPTQRGSPDDQGTPCYEMTSGCRSCSASAVGRGRMSLPLAQSPLGPKREGGLVMMGVGVGGMLHLPEASAIERPYWQLCALDWVGRAEAPRKSVAICPL